MLFFFSRTTGIHDIVVTRGLILLKELKETTDWYHFLIFQIV